MPEPEPQMAPVALGIKAVSLEYTQTEELACLRGSKNEHAELVIIVKSRIGFARLELSQQNTPRTFTIVRVRHSNSKVR